jgi:hypothetical protein
VVKVIIRIALTWLRDWLSQYLDPDAAAKLEAAKRAMATLKASHEENERRLAELEGNRAAAVERAESAERDYGSIEYQKSDLRAETAQKDIALANASDDDLLRSRL